MKTWAFMAVVAIMVAMGGEMAIIGATLLAGGAGARWYV